ncbi:hypothetical protein JCM6882_004950 [Rhodosporidiobolus microsporus]
MVSFLRRSKEAADQAEGQEVATRAVRAPVLLRFRSSTAFIALAAGFGVLVDLSSYAIIVPVIPFRLQELGYDDIGGKTGWLVAAYAGGLIVSSPPAAWIGAKWKNRQIPLTIGLLFMAGAIILFMETSSFVAMVIARIMQGFSGTVLWTIGLALVTDSVPEARVGVVLGYVMIGFSLGQAIGPPVGGTMYARLGYRAPFIFSIILVGVDLLLRLCIIEKHQALRYIAMGHRIEGFEAPGYEGEEAVKEGKGKEVGRTETEGTVVGEGEAVGEEEKKREEREKVEVPLSENTPGEPSIAKEGKEALEKRDEAVRKEEAEGKEGVASRIPEEFLGFYVLCKSPRAMTNVYLSFMNGFIFGSLLDTGMTLYLETTYHLTSLGAGLVFLGAVIPTFFASPLAGWWTDKYGAKWIMVAGVALSIPAFPLLIIRGPLALFVFFLVLIGISVSLFLTPVTVDLSICAAESPILQTAHVFGTFNMAFSIGSFIGPIIAGQIISAIQIKKAWLTLAILAAALSALALPAVVLWVGGRLKLGKKGDELGKEREEA